MKKLVNLKALQINKVIFFGSFLLLKNPLSITKDFLQSLQKYQPKSAYSPQ